MSAAGPSQGAKTPSGGSAAHAVASVGAIKLRWPAEAIWEAMCPLWPDFSVEVLAQLDSTNSELMRRARAGQFAPVLLVAEHQSAGRGRHGRLWHSAAHGDSGASLTFSVGLPLAPGDWAGLSLAVGVSVAKSLHEAIRLKWPNDLWTSDGVVDRKLGGILIETASFAPEQEGRRYAVIGVGLNITAATQALPTPPVALEALMPGITAPDALLRIAVPLMQALRGFEASGFAPFLADFDARDVLRGRAVTAIGAGGAIVQGRACGVASNGALLVHTASGMSEISSSEVSVRPDGRGTASPCA